MRNETMRLLMLGFSMVLAGQAVATSSVGEEPAAAAQEAAAVAIPADNCFTPDVKRCCASAGATLTVSCAADGVQWTCRTTPSQNDLYKTTKSSATGWESSRETGNEFKCAYKKVSCGTAPNQCNHEQADTVAVCKEKRVDGGFCESPPTAAGLGE